MVFHLVCMQLSFLD